MITLKAQSGIADFTLTPEKWETLQDYTETLVTYDLIGELALGLSDSECMAVASEVQDSTPFGEPMNNTLVQWLRSCGGYSVASE